MSTATQGRAREYAVRDHMARSGWVPIMRAAASKGPGDLLLGHLEHGAALVQVGTANKTLGPTDRYRLLEACELIGALPLLAAVGPRKQIQVWVVNEGPASQWEPFELVPAA
jgi:hypothetical protein